MKISLAVPAYNEEKSIRRSVESWLVQSRPADEIIVIDDCSTDRTGEILAEFGDKIKVIRTPRNSGNKSRAQEYGFGFVTGDIMVTTDGDTLLHVDFLKYIEENFKDPKVAAAAGYVKSLKYNWLTSCRAIDYAIAQNIDKVAQDGMEYLYVIPGVAAAFRMDVFKKLGFNHDTLAEDLDFTYKIHKLGYSIAYDRRAICFTQDPADIRSYFHQMRRWYAGGWQNLVKHLHVPTKIGMSVELSMIYSEGLIFSFLMFLLPLINFALNLVLVGIFGLLTFIFVAYGAWREKRWDFIIFFPCYIALKYVNAYVFLEQFVKEVILRQKNLTWVQPERIQMDSMTQ